MLTREQLWYENLKLPNIETPDPKDWNLFVNSAEDYEYIYSYYIMYKTLKVAFPEIRVELAQLFMNDDGSFMGHTSFGKYKNLVPNDENIVFKDENGGLIKGTFIVLKCFYTEQDYKNKVLGTHLLVYIPELYDPMIYMKAEFSPEVYSFIEENDPNGRQILGEIKSTIDNLYGIVVE